MCRSSEKEGGRERWGGRGRDRQTDGQTEETSTGSTSSRLAHRLACCEHGSPVAEGGLLIHKVLGVGNVQHVP